jgi:hypothetical protein
MESEIDEYPCQTNIIEDHLEEEKKAQDNLIEVRDNAEQSGENADYYDYPLIGEESSSDECFDSTINTDADDSDDDFNRFL